MIMTVKLEYFVFIIIIIIVLIIMVDIVILNIYTFGMLGGQVVLLHCSLTLLSTLLGQVRA